MEKNCNLTLHSYKNGYIAEANVEKSKSGAYSDYELIFIVDRSGSMSCSYPILLNKIIPYLLDKLKFPENKPTHFIAFEDFVEYRMFKKSDFLNCKEPAPGGIEKMTDIFPELRKIFTPENEKTPFRILTLSDGEIVVAEERRKVPILASELSEEIKGRFRINSQAIRYFTSTYARPDTLALASVLQLNTIREATLLDIDWKEPYNEAGDKIYELFKDDGFDCNLMIKSNKECIKPNPWSEVKLEMPLFIGKNFFWVDNFDDKTEFTLKINEDQEIKMEIKKGEEINISNYGIILSGKISEYLNKLKILKIVDSDKAKKEIEQMCEKFKNFEDCLERTEKEEEITLKDGKMASRIIYLKKLINKRKGLISNQMDKIKNESRLSEFNSQQQADYLRSVDDTKLGKSLAKRALNSGDLNAIASKEIEAISRHIEEINDIDYSSHPSSFYSTCTTLESLKEICELEKESFFQELQLPEILKLFNIVGIACNGKVGEYPDPSVYIVKNIYPGCYISMADIATAEEYSKGKEHLQVPGTKEEINNCIPIFSDEKVYNLLKNCPKILEILAGLGMRRVLGDIPLTFESLILSGLWKIIGILKTKKSEINISTFLDICNSMKLVCGTKYDNVIDIIKEQLKDKENKNGLFINNYGLFQMLPVLYNCAKNKTFSDKSQMQKIFRAIFRFEVYKLIRARIRKSEKKEDFIKESLNAALGIDFEKYGTKLPELFQKKIDPQFHDEFHINKEVIKEYLKAIGWTELIPFSYILFSASFDSNATALENIKNVKEYKFENVKEEFGINYDFDKFIIFNIVQSFVYKDKIDRDNEKDKIMKILDSNNEEEVDKFLREKVKHIYATEYNIENQKQIKKQFEIISTELIEKIVSSKDISEFNDLMKNGITKGYLTHKILNDSSKGYIGLKKSLLNETIDVPLRYEKLKSIISGKDDKGENLWNNGNAIRTHRKEYQVFIQKNNPQLWEEICKINLEHNYREKINRQGHSNTKKSYWAKGFDTLQDFYQLSEKKDIEKYKEIHNNCCGLGDPDKSIKALKKVQRKQKRKEFREKKKESTKKETKDKDSEKMSIEEPIRGGRGRGYRGRGRKVYYKRRGGSRGRGGRGGIARPMDVDIIEREDEINEPYEEYEEMENDFVGRKTKKTAKKLKKKEKENKKMDKKIKKMLAKK